MTALLRYALQRQLTACDQQGQPSVPTAARPLWRATAFLQQVHETTTFLGASPPGCSFASIRQIPCYQAVARIEFYAVLPASHAPAGLFPISSGIDTRNVYT